MNPTELTTKQDLINLEERIVNKMTTLLKQKPQVENWLKSADVRKILGISPGSLQTLRVNGIIPFSKLNGTLYYKLEDITDALNKYKSEGSVK